MRPKAEHSMMSPNLKHLPKQLGQRRERLDVDKWRIRQGLIRPGGSLEHPGRNLQPAIRLRSAHLERKALLYADARASNCVVRGCYNCRNLNCTESEAEPLLV